MTQEVKVHPLVSPWGRFGLYSFFIDAPEPAIVDTGIASSPAEGMVPELEKLGRSIEDVRWILLTHGHIDHLGGAHALWELTGRRAQVVIHEADAPLLRSRRAHVDQYVDVRQQYLNNPNAVEEQLKAADQGHLRRDGADHAGEGRRDPVPGRGRHRLRAPHPGPHGRLRGLRRGRAAVGLRRRRRADPRCRQRLPRLRGSGRLPLEPAVPARRGPSAAPVPGPPVPGCGRACPTASNWTAEAARMPCRGAWTSRPGSTTPPAAACATACRRRTRCTPRSPRWPRSSATPGDPTLEPSPFFTTLHGYRRQVDGGPLTQSRTDDAGAAPSQVSAVVVPSASLGSGRKPCVSLPRHTVC